LHLIIRNFALLTLRALEDAVGHFVQIDRTEVLGRDRFVVRDHFRPTQRTYGLGQLLLDDPVLEPGVFFQNVNNLHGFHHIVVFEYEILPCTLDVVFVRVRHGVVVNGNLDIRQRIDW